MKKFLSCTKTAIALLIVAVLALGFYTYMLARPISYGMGYHNKTAYDGGVFEGTIKFYPDGTMVNRNTNFEEAQEDRYYYKNGYVFSLMAQTDEEYDKEVAAIDADFDAAVKTPFYASKINAFKEVPVSVDGYTTVYTCTPAIIFASVFGAFELILIGLTTVSFVLSKKANNVNA